MAEITKELGRIPVSRGNYQSTTEYYKDNIVQYKRGSYQVVSESPIVGVPPTNDNNIVNPGWRLFAGIQGVDDVPTAGSENLVESGGVENRLSLTDLRLGDKKIYQTETSTTTSKSYNIPLSFNSGDKVKFKMLSDFAVSQAYLVVTYNGSKHNHYIGNTYEIEFDNDNSIINIWVAKSMFSQNGTLNIEIEAVESINKDIKSLQERVVETEQKIITPEVISDVSIINESQTYTVTGSETAGKSIKVEKQFIGNSPIVCTLTCTNDCLSQGKDIVITYADGSTGYVKSGFVGINTDYEITPTKKAVSIEVYAELARIQGTGDITLTIRDKNSNERKINTLDTRVTSTEKSISDLELKDFGLHKTYEVSASTSTSYSFEINEYLPKDTVLKFRMSTESGVLVNNAYFNVNFGEGTAGSRHVNNDYTVELADDTNQISIWVAKSMVAQDGVMTVSIDVDGMSEIVNTNTFDIKDILLATTLNSSWKDCAEEIQKVHDKKFVMCIQTDTHFDFVKNPDKYYVKDASCANNLKLLGATIGANCIINLGDLIQGYSSDELADMRISMTEAVKRYCYPKFCPTLFAIGNHDDNSMNGSPYMSRDEIFGRVFKPMLQTVSNIVLGNGMYYYIDFDDIRVIVLNTQDSNSNLQIFKISTEQANWFTNIALNTDKQIIVASHCPLITELSQEADSSFAAIVTAINLFVSNGGKCIACIAGHTHQQDSYVKDGINYVVFAHYAFRSETMIVDTVNHSVVTKCAGSSISNRTWNY